MNDPLFGPPAIAVIEAFCENEACIASVSRYLNFHSTVFISRIHDLEVIVITGERFVDKTV